MHRQCVRLALFLLFAGKMGAFVVDGFTVLPHSPSSPISRSRMATITATSLTIGKLPGSADDHLNNVNGNPMNHHHQAGSSSRSISSNGRNSNAHHHNHMTIQQQASNQRKKTQEDQGLSMMSSISVPGTEYMQHPLDRNLQLLQDMFYSQNISKGTRVHLINGITSLIVLSKFMFFMNGRRTCSCLSSIALLFGFIGLAFDNIVNACGKYIGCGRKLRLLTKCRLIFHGAG